MMYGGKHLTPMSPARTRNRPLSPGGLEPLTFGSGGCLYIYKSLCSLHLRRLPTRFQALPRHRLPSYRAATDTKPTNRYVRWYVRWYDVLYMFHLRFDALPNAPPPCRPRFCTQYEYFLYSPHATPATRRPTMTTMTSNESSRCPLQRFPDFGKELRRPFEVHELCYDCAEFYGPGHGERGCDGWPADKPVKPKDGGHLLCLDFNRLPDVMPGEPTGQMFPPSRMNGRRTPRERNIATSATVPLREKRKLKATPAAQDIDPKRQCVCGRHLPKRRRYCDHCRQARRYETMRRFEKSHPGRSHRVSRLPQNRPEGVPMLPESRATVNMTYDTPHRANSDS